MISPKVLAFQKGATDIEGDYLAPGMVELHADNVERHLERRPKVSWPFRAAILAHDRELAGAGIATIMGASNLIRGGSHSGNVAAADHAQIDRLDILSSTLFPQVCDGRRSTGRHQGKSCARHADGDSRARAGRKPYGSWRIGDRSAAWVVSELPAS
jgi:hypothetical protein